MERQSNSRGEAAKRRKRKKQQPYIVGGFMVLATLTAALVLVYISAKPQDLPVNVGESTPSTVSSDLTEGIEPESTLQSSEDEEAITPSPSSEQTSTAHKAIMSKGEYALTDGEVAELESIILAAEKEVYYTPPVGDEDTASSLTSSTQTSSNQTSSGEKKPMKPPPLNRSVSIYFEDLSSGFSYQYNADKKYFIASLIKAPYSMYLYTLAEQGKCDLTEKLEVKKSDIKEGTGKLKDTKPEEFPLSLTVRELMSYSIIYSDNTAMELLRKKYPHDGYLPYATSLGLKYPGDIKSMVNGNITAFDAGVYAKALYDYMENGKYGSELKKDMTSTKNKMITAVKGNEIARKYGWAELSFHDMAVVFAPQPYVLAICTDASLGNKADYKLFADISSAFARFHQKRYP